MIGSFQVLMDVLYTKKHMLVLSLSLKDQKLDEQVIKFYFLYLSFGRPEKQYALVSQGVYKVRYDRRHLYERWHTAPVLGSDLTLHPRFLKHPSGVGDAMTEWSLLKCPV